MNMIRNKQRIPLVALIFCFTFLYAKEISAQSNSTLTGTVTEAGSGETLVGANIMIRGTTIGTSADVDGSYRLSSLRPGTYTIDVTYIGFRPVTREITLEARQQVRVDFELEWIGIVGDELLITAQARGQIAAINQQRSSNTISNIVSSDRIRELPDVNAAESIGRLPGVSINRSGGEANKVAVRGLSPKYNTVTVNGVRMPSVDTQNRSVDLSLISSNMLDGIVLTKALTPDQDADAIGGTIDLRLRTAPSTPTYDFEVQGGYNALQKTYGNYKITGSTGRRFIDNRIGLILSFHLDSFNRSVDRFGGNYEVIANPQAGGEMAPNVTSLNLQERELTRSRRGGSALIDYEFTDGKIVLNTFYNFLRNDGYNRTNNLQVRNGEHKYSMSRYRGDAEIFTSSINYEHDFRFFQIDAGAYLTSSLNHHPEDYFWDFMELSAVDVSRMDEVRFAPPTKTPTVFRNNIDNTFYNYMSVSNRKTTEGEGSFAANLKVPFRLGSSITGYFKTGGRYRRLEKEHNQEQIGRDIFWGGGQELRNLIAEQLPELGLEQGMARIPLTFFQDDYDRDNFLRGDYPLGYTMRSSDLMRVTNIARPYMYYDGQNSLGNDYNGMEEYKAAYAMTEINLGRHLVFMPGFRFESEYTDYSAKFVIGGIDPPLDEDGRPVQVNYRDTTTVRSDQHLLPMVHMQIRPTDWINLRLAYTQTLSRPDFRQYAPITYLSRFRDWMNAPNTQLKTSRSVNYDASVSFYRNRLGFFTVSGFYKDIHDLIWHVNFPLVEGQTVLPDIHIPNLTGVPRVSTSLNNIYTATVKGVEFDWQTSFWYLPSVLKGLVLNLNYTILDSETRYPQFRREQVPIEPRPRRPPFTTDVVVDTFRVGRMPDQPSSIANITIGYDYKEFSVRFSYLYQSDILRSLASNPAGDQFTEDYYRFDISVKQGLPMNLQLTANFNNINNRADRNYQSEIQDFPTFIEYYGFTMDIGLRYRF